MLRSHRINQVNCDKSSGTLLPLPALYLFAPPIKSLGFGNWWSSWNLHRGSSVLNDVFPIELLLAEDVVPCLAGPFDRV